MKVAAAHAIATAVDDVALGPDFIISVGDGFFGWRRAWQWAVARVAMETGEARQQVDLELVARAVARSPTGPSGARQFPPESDQRAPLQPFVLLHHRACRTVGQDIEHQHAVRPEFSQRRVARFQQFLRGGALEGVVNRSRCRCRQSLESRIASVTASGK